MGTVQKYSLKWNDFSLNVASTFGDLYTRHDFVDVTLACSDGSTLDAHKIILSSVSTYFCEILKNNPCKHPIVVLKDTSREEAAAMLEFAYTGEVHIDQDLLSGLLHTARCFRIKGLDKMECPDEPYDHSTSQVSGKKSWKNETSISNKPFFHLNEQTPKELNNHTVEKSLYVNNIQNLLQTLENDIGINCERNSHPSKREGSPNLQQQIRTSSPLTTPSKRWKRSVDNTMKNGKTERPIPLVYKNSSSQNFYSYIKRIRAPFLDRPLTNFGGVTYSQSMPTSPTMIENDNERRLSGITERHFLNEFFGNSVKMDENLIQNQNLKKVSKEPTALDYRIIRNDGKSESKRHNLMKSLDNYKFRHENISTGNDNVQDDTSPEFSDTNDTQGGNFQDEELRENLIDDWNGFNIGADGQGHFICDKCEKVFRHPGSLQHHKHIHKGTHKCPSCGKPFSRRWDMERHLNKSKYGCPGNRHLCSESTNVSPSLSPSLTIGSMTPAALAASTQLDLLAAVSNKDHNISTTG